jgi:hypothetical protein
MNDQSAAPPQTRDTPKHPRSMNQLLWFFALVYVVEGMGQIGGLIAQPLNFFLKEV